MEVIRTKRSDHYIALLIAKHKMQGEKGSTVQFDAYGGEPLYVISHINPAQDGSGDPSPDNVRPIVHHNYVELTLTSADGAHVLRKDFDTSVLRGSYNWGTGELLSNAKVRDISQLKPESTGTSSTGIKYVKIHNGGENVNAILACNRYQVVTGVPSSSGYIRAVSGGIYIYDNAIDFDNPSAA